jgi:hypothetical protein
MAARSSTLTPNGKTSPASCGCACSKPKGSRAAFWAKVALVLAILTAAFRYADGIKVRLFGCVRCELSEPLADLAFSSSPCFR